MSDKTWTSDTYASILTPAAWSTNTAPAPLDNLVMRHGAAFTWGNTVPGTLYAGSTDPSNPVWLWTGYSLTNIDMGVGPGDSSNAGLEHRALEIYAYGPNTINLMDQGYRPGGGGDVAIYIADNSAVDLNARVNVNSSLQVSGPGALIGGQLDTWRGNSIITSDMLGGTLINLYGETRVEIGGTVTDDAHMTFWNDQDRMVVDNASTMHGWLDFTHGDQTSQIDLAGLHADAASFANDHMIFKTAGATVAELHITIPAAGGFDMWQTASGVQIGGIPKPTDQFLGHAGPS